MCLYGWWGRRPHMKISRVMSYLKLHSKSFLRSKSGVFFVILLPVLFMVIFGSIFGSSGESKATVAVQNLSGTNESWNLVKVINKTGVFTVNLVSPNENLTSYMAANTIDQGVLIPANFSTNYNLGVVFIKFIYNPSDQVSLAMSQVLQNALLKYYTEGTGKTVAVYPAALSTQLTKPVDYYIPGLMGFTMLNGINSMIYQVPNYREKKIFRQLSFAGLTKPEWLASSTIFYFIITLVSDLIIYLVGRGLYGANISISPENLLMTVLVIFFGLITFMSVGLLAGLLTHNEETASVVGNVIFFPMLFLSGVFFPISLMPSYLQTVSAFLPLTYFVKALNGLMIYHNLSSVLPSIIIMGIASVTLFMVSSRLASRVDNM